METKLSVELRTMVMSDLGAVLEIIEAHDEDDAEAAESEYEEVGIENQYVLVDAETVIGVTGYRPVAACDNTYWLSWTYLAEAHRGKGLGKRMLADLLNRLRDQNGRKIFVKVSDYETPEGEKIYQAALHMYQSLGFEIELINHDFYDEGENQMILGLNLRQFGQTDGADAEVKIADEKPDIRFNGLYEIAETDGAYSFSWMVKKSARWFGNRSFSKEDLELGISSVKNEGGRKVFLTFPSNLALIHRPLQSVGFEYVGRLKDYYEVGLDELHFSHNLKKLADFN